MSYFKVAFFLFGLFVLFIVCFFFFGRPSETQPEIGITWSQTYADYLGISSPEGLEAVFREMPQIKHVRIPAYWSLIEQSEGNYDYAWLDELIGIAQSQNAHITLAVGSRLPRWPECWKPKWVTGLPIAKQQEVQLKHIKRLVEKYHSVVSTWQVENEVTLESFQSCEGIDIAFTKKEIALVKQELQRQQSSATISTTESGELSHWKTFAQDVDRIGISVYHKVLTPGGNVWSYAWLPKSFYLQKAKLLFISPNKLYVSEYQLEPWTTYDIRTLSQEDIEKTLRISDLMKRIEQVRALGVNRVDLWGAEWWYWMMQDQKQPIYWDTIKNAFKR